MAMVASCSWEGIQHARSGGKELTTLTRGSAPQGDGAPQRRNPARGSASRNSAPRSGAPRDSATGSGAAARGGTRDDMTRGGAIYPASQHGDRGDRDRGDRYPGYDRSERYDRRESRDRHDRYDDGGRDWPGYDRADRDRAGHDRAGSDRERRDYDSRKGSGSKARRSAPVRGIAALLAVAATASLAVTGYACTLAVLNRVHLGRGAHSGTAAGSYVVTGIASFVSSSAIVSALSSAKPTPAATPAAPAPVSLVLTARDKRDCPAAATACVDLAEHITWLQSNGTVTYGPVQMEPGPPGTVHATPTGTFNVAWKAGPTYMSTIYHLPIPWAVFFAPGGIAFHAGSLTVGSHGCVHLTMDAARYYNEHLPVGAEVVVF